MNKVFRVIWSEAQGAWVAVSETTKSHSKRSRKAALALALAAGGLMGVTGYASATSTGEIGPGSIAIGPAAGPCAKTDAKDERSISIGCEAGGSAVGNNQTNLGFQAGADSEGEFNTALGSNTGESVKGKNNTAVGLSSGGLVKGDNNAAVGYSAGRNVTGDDNAAIGNNAGTGVKGDRNLSFGSKAGRGVEGFDNAAFGSNAGENVTGKRNTGFGNSAGKGVQGDSNTSLGDSAGRSLRGEGNLSAGLVAGQNTFGDHNVMLGNKASTVGSEDTKRINRTVVIGSEAEAYFDDTVALGSKAKAEHANSVALGSQSQTREAKSETEGVISYGTGTGTKTYKYSGFFGTASGVVSVGSVGAERQIINVAPGAITSTSTDAVNGSQLYFVAEGLNKRIDGIDTSGGGWNVVTSNTSPDESKVAPGAKVDFVSSDKNVAIKHTPAAGGNTSIDFALSDDLKVGSKDGTDGKIAVNGTDGVSGVTINGADGSIGLTGKDGTNGTITVAKGQPGVNGQPGETTTRIIYEGAEGPEEVATLNDGLKFAGNTGETIAKKLNDTLTVSGDLEEDEDASGANLRVDSKGGQLNLVMAKDLTDINSITINNGGPIISGSGINMGNKQITNVAEGVLDTDGVNFGQLKKYVGDQLTNITGGDWELSTGSGADESKVTVGDGGKVSINGNKDGNIDVALGKDPVTGEATGDLTIATKPDVTHDSVTTGGTVMNDNGVTIKDGTKDGPSITKNGVDAGGKKITSVAKGDISDTSTDAINGSQLNDTNNRVKVNEGDIANNTTNITKNAGDIANNAGNIENIQNGKDGMFQVSQDYNTPKPTPTGEKSVAGGAGAVASGKNSAAIGNDSQATGENSTALGNSASAKHNNSVALGNGSETDRVNSVSVGTVGGERQITNVAAGVAPTDAVNVSQLDALGSKVNQYFNAANKRIDKVDNNARAGIAAAMAAGTLPQSTLPGKSMVTVGASTYRGESAIALGVSRLSDNARTVIKANASADSRGNAGAAVGAGWHW